MTETDLIEVFRSALMADHADDWDMETVSAAAHTCAAAIVDNALVVLNRVHEADPTVLPDLIAHRVACNRAVADDPTVQVGRYGPPQSDMWEVGLLGIVNGLLGIDERHYGPIAAVFDDNHQLVRFDRSKVEST